MTSVACSDWPGRLFQGLTPLYEKLFWPFQEFFFGTMRPVGVFLKLCKELIELATN